MLEPVLCHWETLAALPSAGCPGCGSTSLHPSLPAPSSSRRGRAHTSSVRTQGPRILTAAWEGFLGFVFLFVFKARLAILFFSATDHPARAAEPAVHSSVQLYEREQQTGKR